MAVRCDAWVCFWHGADVPANCDIPGRHLSSMQFQTANPVSAGVAPARPWYQLRRVTSDMSPEVSEAVL